MSSPEQINLPANQALTTPEAAPQTHEERLLELVSPAPEQVDGLKQQFQAITKRVLDTAVNPHDQHTIALTAGIAHWRLFGEPGDPLPAGLVQGHDPDGALRIRYDTRIGLDAHCVGSALEQLEQAGLEKLVEPFKAPSDERSNSMAATCRTIIRESQAFQFISSLANDAPRQATEQPLTQYWRDVHGGRIEEGVRHRWSLESREPMQIHINAHNELRRGITRLDMATMPAPEQSEDDLATLRSYITEFMLAEVEAKYPGETFVGFAGDEFGLRKILTDKSPNGHPPHPTLSDAAEKIAKQMQEKGAHVPVLTKEWIAEVIDMAICPNDSLDFNQISQMALDKVWSFVHYPVTNGRILQRHDYTLLPSRRIANIHAGLVTPPDQPVDLSQLPEIGRHEHSEIHNYGSAEINDDAPDTPAATVVSATPYVHGKHAKRLLQKEPARAGLPPLKGDEELVLSTHGEDFKNVQPFIPGYVLVSKNMNYYGFARAEQGDPYAPANIPLTAEQRSTLAEQYRGIELTELTDTIESTPDLTVQGLAAIISRAATYVDRQMAKSLEPPLPTDYHAYDLEEFSGLVRDGELYVQCTGAAQFLKLSLEEAFGKGTASTTDGLMLKSRIISSAFEHQQTVFVHEGKAYILDATPGSGRATQENDNSLPMPRGNWLQRLKRNNPAVAATAASNTVNVDFDSVPPVQTAPAETAPDPATRIQEIHNTFSKHLARLLQAEDGRLYEKVVALAIDDPFRRTAETSLRASYGEAGRAELEHLDTYLKLYAQANDALRRVMKVPSYSEQSVRLLQTTVAQLLEHV